MLQMLLPVVGSLIDKIIPDPAQAAEAKLKAMDLAQKGELAALDANVRLAIAQMEINKEEAKSPDMFRGGWRPAVGWVCVGGLLYTYIGRPMLPWFVTVLGADVPALPAIDTTELMILLGGMLGLGGFRTLERLNGKA